MPRVTGKSILRLGAVVLAIIGMGLFGCFVWPTAYRHTTLRMGGNAFPVRINRFTGTAYLLRPSGWQEVPAAESEKVPAAEPAEELSSSELAGLEGQAYISNTGTDIFVNLYNGTGHDLKELVVVLAVQGGYFYKSGGSHYESRRYRLRPDSTVPVFETGTFSAALGFTLPPGRLWNWKIYGARGVRSKTAVEIWGEDKRVTFLPGVDPFDEYFDSKAWDQESPLTSGQ
ncbi:MAG TPA: hypothetical protein VGX68_10885 [Thermoanaerobaculia bacterium]|jgi:hypothetical protein|nr:hypothetical protein [Thermoanaerobaculia bacterium]